MTEWADFATCYQWQQADDAAREAGIAEPSGFRRALRAFLAALAVACFALALGLWGCSELRRREMADAAPVEALEGAEEPFGSDAADGSAGAASLRASPAGGGGADAGALAADASGGTWADAEGKYPGLSAWLMVRGTAVSTAVMQGSERDPAWYLSHNAWGYRDAAGMPYLDPQTSASSPMRVVYGHNMGWGSSERFGPLADAWQQGAFDGLESALWAVPGYRTLTFVPLMALEVSATGGAIFDFDANRSQVSVWAKTLLDGASARSPRASELAERATEALVLVTCVNGIHPASMRSVVVFVR